MLIHLKWVKHRHYKKKLGNKGICIAFVLASLLVHPLPLFILILLNKQVMIETHALQINGELGMMATKLSLAEVKSFAKVFGGYIFNNIQKI